MQSISSAGAPDYTHQIQSAARAAEVKNTELLPLRQERDDAPLDGKAAEFRHEPRESAGQYWLEPKEGGPEVKFSPPSTTPPIEAVPATAEESEPVPKMREPQKAAEPDNEPAKHESITRCSTDKVDGELEKLRNRVAELEKQALAADEESREDIDRQLDAAKRELAQKDNDTYRRQHAQFTQLS